MGNLSHDMLDYEIVETYVGELKEMRDIAYGIRVKNSDGICLLERLDISTSIECVKNFVHTLKSRNVASVHIAELLDDCIGEYNRSWISA